MISKQTPERRKFFFSNPTIQETYHENEEELGSYQRKHAFKFDPDIETLNKIWLKRLISLTKQNVPIIYCVKILHESIALMSVLLSTHQAFTTSDDK